VAIAVPASISGRAPILLITWEMTPDISTTTAAKGRNATPDFSAL
jgi:hypothetical protein